jgi:putative component of toxin-antitoxin plasmid stabilization module
MRVIQISGECKHYIDSHPKELVKKVKYCIQILSEQKVIHTKLVKKLIATEFYELRISIGKEHRIILFAANNPNLIESTRIILLNGFIKKSNKDYKKAIEVARKLVVKYNLNSDE